MKFKSLLVLFVVALLVMSTATLVLAKGGQGNNAMNVCWLRNLETEVWANFVVTGSGIVQQFRYAPEDRHLIFKPTSKFPNEPKGEGWNDFTFRGQYDSCDPATEYSLEDVFELGESYWVKITDQG